MRAPRVAAVALLLTVSPLFGGEPYISTEYSIWQARGIWDSYWYPIEEVTHLGVLDGRVVVTGVFDHAGNTYLEPPAVHDGSRWTAPLGVVQPGWMPQVAWQGDLVIGRHRWDGQSTVELVGSNDFSPKHLAAQGEELVGVGHLYGQGTHACRWDPNLWDWVALGERFTDQDGAMPDVLGIATWQDGVVVVGDALDLVGSLPIDGVAYWDGNVWSAMGSQISNNGDVTAVVVYQDQLLVGAYGGIYRWNGVDWEIWSSMTGGNRRPGAFALDGDDLLVGGSFDHVGGVAARAIARWDGMVWSPLGIGVSGQALALAVNGSDVYVGGTFVLAGGRHAFNLARYDGTQWHHMGEGGLGFEAYPSVVSALLSFDGSVVVAGEIPSWGAFSLANVVRREGDGWATLGAGLNGPVTGLLEYEGDLVARGAFTASGATPLEHLARWDGTRWTPMLGSLQGELLAMTRYGAGLVIAGEFYNVDGVVTPHLARFDGSSWHALPGLSGAVEAVTEFEGDLIAAGRFLFAGGQLVNRVARFDGAQWHGMDGGVGWTATALAVVDGVLYVGGDFTTAGGQPAEHIAYWDGGGWQPLGGGLGAAPSVIEGHDGSVMMGGLFDTVDGMQQHGIAAWDPVTSQWVDPGYELGGACLALESVGDALHLGGGFSEILPDGGSPVSSLLYGLVTSDAPTPADAVASPRMQLEVAPNPFNPTTTLTYELDREDRVLLALFDVRGRRVVTLVDAVRPSGRHQIVWSGADAAGRRVASGVYLAKLRTSTMVQTRKLVLVQ